jgi:hypothetical protein
MPTMWEILKALQPSLEERETISRKEWNAVCAVQVTTSRRQASHYWEILGTLKVLRPINGTTWRVDHDTLFSLMARCGPAGSGPAPIEQQVNEGGVVL